jgi:CubicO group peptidase (beta-lactamase class C family)
MVFTWGEADRKGDVASACKPWYTHFLLAALEGGKSASLDDKVAQFQPGLASINEKLGHKDREITWRHLSNQVSCYGVEERPGEAYDYSDYNISLFFDTLFLGVYGSSWKNLDDELLHPKLTDILQCLDTPTFLAFGLENRPGRLAVSPRDFARFGLLYLRQGRWKGRQILRREHVSLATSSPLPNRIPRTAGKPAEMIPAQRSIGGGNNQCDHLGSYSFTWWTNGVDREGKRHWPDAPLKAYGAFGHGGVRAMVVLPGLGIVTSWNDSKIKSREAENEALRLLVEACAGKKSGSQ